MKPLRSLATLYGPAAPTVVAYMLQTVEYQPKPYLQWFWRTWRFDRVMRRQRLEPTKAARALRLVVAIGMVLQVIAAVICFMTSWWMFGLLLLVSYPLVWAHLVILPLILGRILIIEPRERQLIAESKQLFHDHPGARIAVAGSYGKTSMKELLATVLAEGKTVAATPANKNVAISHARFAANLKGDEDVLIIEFGEGQPGDVARFTDTVDPTHAVITGLAPAHLDQYEDVAAAGRDIFSLAEGVDADHVFVNSESVEVKSFLKPGYKTYNRSGVLGWKVEDIHIGVEGTDFMLVKSKRSIHLQSKLLGMHQVGPLALAAALGLRLGLSEAQVISGIAKTVPFEHRMQPYRLNGAWVIDDTYNGTLEGIRAGSALLASLEARRKIYVTPGLVEQGAESDSIHEAIGHLIAAADPDKVVLMQNSAAPFIKRGLLAAGYAGELGIEADPLKYYTNFKEYLAAGDVIMLQNDWTDNYA